MTLFFKAMMLGCVIGLMWLWLFPRAEAQSKPFTVYETTSACVFVAGYGSSPAIAAFPKSSISVFGGC